MNGVRKTGASEFNPSNLSGEARRIGGEENQCGFVGKGYV